jgi:hypothetical protein
MEKEKLFEECKRILDTFDHESVFYIPKLLKELQKYKTEDLSNQIITDARCEIDDHWIRISSYGGEVCDIGIDGIWASEKDDDD